MYYCNGTHSCWSCAEDVGTDWQTIVKKDSGSWQTEAEQPTARSHHDIEFILRTLYI